MYKTKHDRVAEGLANKFHTKYKSDKGIDLVLPRRVIEVEVKKNGIQQGISQVVRSTKARYLAVTPELVKTAIEMTEGKGIGIMSQSGRVVKAAR